jgi:hypothetical protein
MTVRKTKGLRSISMLFYFIFLTFCGFSQVSYTRKEIKEFKRLNDICNCLPDNATNISYVVLANVGGKAQQYSGQGDTLNGDTRLLMNTADQGSKIYMDIKCATTSSPLLKVNAFAFRVVK